MAKNSKIRPVVVPKPSRDAYKYYNTMIFHGYFRSGITFLSLVTGIWILFAGQADEFTRSTALYIHLTAGFVGIYLIAFHVLGYFACKHVHSDYLAEPRKQLTDTGWVMVGMASTSLITGLIMWRSWIDDPNIMRFIRLLHVSAALCYVAMSVTHLHYYWNRWKPTLKAGKKGFLKG